MISFYDVSGCYILRPWSYYIWECIQHWFDSKIKESGVQNCYFPCFVSQDKLEKEKEHIADFAPEVAWVTKAGSSDLAKPIALRPTSETIMYPAYADWVQSHRDLPLRLNQWNNVVRWEFKNPTPFLRTREFLWQEGHSAFATQEEAHEEVMEMLGYYEQVYTELLAVPVIPGKKTEKEKFAGGDYTTTVEGYIPAASRAIQGATSHGLGQNFSKMFDITFQDKDGNKGQHVWQNSWGCTTRTIGVMIMIHSDDRGLVLPPRVAPLHVVIVPIPPKKTKGQSEEQVKEDMAKIHAVAEDVFAQLKQAGLKVKFDDRDNYNPGWKFNDWELKGVPLRFELGLKDLEKNQVTVARRIEADPKKREHLALEADLAEQTVALLEQVQDEMYRSAVVERDSRLRQVTTWAEFPEVLSQGCMCLVPFCGDQVHFLSDYADA
jgi:prolyl-tRNA synthetase family I